MRPSITLSADLARQHELIDAAIAVNEAPTLDEFKNRFITEYVKANRQKASGIAHKETYLKLYIRPALGMTRLD